MMVNRYAVGKIISCFGIKGYVKVYPSTYSPERLKKFRSVFVGTTPETSLPVRMEDIVINRKGIFVKLSTLSDRTEAEAAVGQYLFISGTDLGKPAKGSYFIDEIVGCVVETIDGTEIGTLEDVLKTPAQDLWVIRTIDSKNVYLPAVKEFIKKVDIADGKIVIKLIDGLLEV